MKFKNKITLSIFVIAIMSASQLARAENVVINQAFQSLLYLPLYVAQEKGYFKEQGVEVKITTGGGGAQSWAAVIGGSANFSIQDPVFVPKTIENGGDGLVVAAVQNGPSVFVLSKDPTMLNSNLAHLQGKKVIVTPQPDTTWAYMSYLIRQQKLKDVKLVSVGVGNELPALQANAADYALTFEPLVSQGVAQQGFHVVYAFPDDPSWSPFAFSGLTTTRKYVESHPQAAQGVVTAFEKASRYIYSNFNDSVKVAQKYFPNLPEQVVRDAVKREVDVKGYPQNALVSKKSWDNAMNVALFAKNIKAYPSDSTNYERNIDTTLATKARAVIDAEK